MKSVDCRQLYENAEWYDLQHQDFTADLPMYRTLADRYEDPILELACGTGRIALDLNRQDHSVTGLDISESMVKRARDHAADTGADVTFYHGDVRGFDLAATFGLILFPFNSISHLHDRESLEGMFKCVRQHLAPGGRFVVSMFVPKPAYLVRDPNRRYPVSRFSHPRDGEITITESSIYDPVHQINRITWFYKISGINGEICVQNNMRMFYPQEFRSLLHYNGFRVETVYGGYDMRPQDERSPMQIYVTRTV